LTRSAAIPIALFVCLVSFCLLAYSGAIESNDAGRLLDAVRSFVDWGDLRLDLMNVHFPSSVAEVRRFPLEDAGAEPGQIIAAAPLYLLARAFPGIGTVHTLWLFGAIVTALTGVLLYAFARALRAGHGAGVLLALAFTLASAAYPYSKTFFREPLTALLLLSSAYCAHRARLSGLRLGWLLATAAACAGLLLTRASALFALPALLIYLVPAPHQWGFARRAWADRRTRALLIAAALLLIGAFAALTLFGDRLGLGGRYNVVARVLSASTDTLPTALAAYLLSPGGSIWGTSPILLLALPGALLLIRRRQTRLVIAGALALGGFAVGYAVFNGTFWFGGLSWTPRFLVPVIPLLMLLTLPILSRAVHAPRSLWGIGVGFMLLYGIWINLSAVSLPWGAYARALPPEAGEVLDWQPGLYDPAYFRWVLTPTRWAHEPSDIAWLLIGAPEYLLFWMALALAALLVVARRIRHPAAPAMLLIALIVLTGTSLTTLYQRDLRYQPDQPALDALLPILERETDRDDIILLSSPRYLAYFQNRGRLTDAGRVVALELQPGERPSEAEPARVTSDYPPALLSREANRLIANFASTRDRLWLVVDGSPDLWWSVRPVERFMASFHYPIRTIQTGALTRLIEFDTALAPDPFGLRGAAFPARLRFGESIRLTGLSLSQPSAAPGESIGVTLWWTTDRPLTARYTAALYLRYPDGAPIAQHDSPPRWGFAPTDSWTPGAPIADHRGLRLPADLPPGDYPLWVKLYDLAPDGTPRDLPVTEGESLDETIGVLPIAIRVR
jgi:hypothetical protein